MVDSEIMFALKLRTKLEVRISLLVRVVVIARVRVYIMQHRLNGQALPALRGPDIACVCGSVRFDGW